MSTLFDMPAPSGEMTVSACRAEVARELAAALKACDQVPEYYLDADKAKAAFEALAAEGDDSWARDQIREAIDDDHSGFGAHLDRLLDHVNALGWAFWRLHRAALRAMGKEAAR